MSEGLRSVIAAAAVLAAGFTWQSVRAAAIPVNAADRLVAELRLAQMGALLLTLVAGAYIGFAVTHEAQPGVGFDIALAVGFFVAAATTIVREPRQEKRRRRGVEPSVAASELKPGQARKEGANASNVHRTTVPRPRRHRLVTGAGRRTRPCRYRCPAAPLRSASSTAPRRWHSAGQRTQRPPRRTWSAIRA